MENFEAQEHPRDYAAEIRRVIDNAPAGIAAELKNSGNNWPACLITILTAARGYADLGQLRSQFSAEKTVALKQIIDNLAEKIQDIMLGLEKGQDITDQEKETLLGELRSILEVL